MHHSKLQTSEASEQPHPIGRTLDDRGKNRKTGSTWQKRRQKKNGWQCADKYSMTSESRLISPKAMSPIRPDLGLFLVSSFPSVTILSSIRSFFPTSVSSRVTRQRWTNKRPNGNTGSIAGKWNTDAGKICFPVSLRTVRVTYIGWKGSWCHWRTSFFEYSIGALIREVKTAISGNWNSYITRFYITREWHLNVKLLESKL